MISTADRSELTISNLDINSDPGTYMCNATNTQGSVQEIMTLRVRSRLAALWPFLGIVAEVLVLVTIIFIYEKRRKPDQTLDGEHPWVWVSGWDTLIVSTWGRNVICSWLIVLSPPPLGHKLVSSVVSSPQWLRQQLCGASSYGCLQRWAAQRAWGLGCVGPAMC